MTTVEIIGLILGSNAAIEVVKYLVNRKQANAGVTKITREAEQIALQSEVKLTEFYRAQLQLLIEKHNDLEERLNEKIKAHQDCESRLDLLESKHTELQRQLTLVKVQLNDRRK